LKDETVEVIFMYSTKDIGEDRVATGTHGTEDAGADNF